MTAWTPIPVGTVLQNRFEITQALKSGGFGATYLAKDRHRFDEVFVLKELLPAQEDQQELIERLFRREAQTLQRLKHDGIPALLAYFEDNGRFYLVQARIQGQTLEELCAAAGPIPEPEVRRILGEALDILDYLHTRTPAIIHRDIKPSNVMMDDQQRVILIDFGAVKEAVAKSQFGVPATRILTKGYAPPEQELYGHVVPASDIYALGVTCIQLLVGGPPWEWLDPATGRWRLSSVAVSRRFGAILERMVDPQLETRLSSAVAVRQTLDEPVATPPPHTVRPTDVDATAAEPLGTTRTEPVYATQPDPPPVTRPRPKLRVPAMAIVALLAGSSIWWYASRDAKDPAPVPAGPTDSSSPSGTPSRGSGPEPAPRDPAPQPEPPAPPPTPTAVLGVRVANDTEMVHLAGKGDIAGVLITEVRKGSAAERAGLQVEDVVTALEGRRVQDGDAFVKVIAEATPGAAIAIEFVRNAKVQQANAVLLAPGETLPPQRTASRPQTRSRQPTVEEPPLPRLLPRAPSVGKYCNTGVGPYDLAEPRPLYEECSVRTKFGIERGVVGRNPVAIVGGTPRLPPPPRVYYTYCETPGGNSGVKAGGTVGSPCFIETARGRFNGVVRLVIR